MGCFMTTHSTLCRKCCDRTAEFPRNCLLPKHTYLLYNRRSNQNHCGGCKIWIYVSTRNKERKVSAAIRHRQRYRTGRRPVLPTAFPALTDADWKTLAESDYKGRSALILGKFLTDFTAEELADFASKAYADEKFGGADTAPVVKLGEGKNLLELWHGPTCAFKDMALQMLPHLLTASLRKTGETRTACILVATSGDTGKAALDGFHDVPGTKIMVYYPVDGVSPMQKLQMVTQEGGNVEIVAIRGNFDEHRVR